MVNKGTGVRYYSEEVQLPADCNSRELLSRLDQSLETHHITAIASLDDVNTYTIKLAIGKSGRFPYNVSDLSDLPRLLQEYGRLPTTQSNMKIFVKLQPCNNGGCCWCLGATPGTHRSAACIYRQASNDQNYSTSASNDAMEQVSDRFTRMTEIARAAIQARYHINFTGAVPTPILTRWLTEIVCRHWLSSCWSHVFISKLKKQDWILFHRIC